MTAKFHEQIKRSLVKSITFRILVLALDIIIMFSITRRYDQTFWLVFLSNIGSTIIYFFHERIWNIIHWGKEKK